MIRDVMDWDEQLSPYRQAVRELCVKFEAYIQRDNEKGRRTQTQTKLPASSPVESVTGRVKRVGSILDKAARKNIAYSSFTELSEQIEDIAGVRIICRFVEDIERAADLVRSRHGVDLRVITERDYVTHTKPSGYRSYHMHIRYPLTMLTGTREVLAEIQIRTMAMNFWATIEHSLKYKYNGMLPEPLQKRLLASAEAAFVLDTEMSAIQYDIMEAQRQLEHRNDVVDKILRNIRNLYHNARLDTVDELNREFLILNEEGSLDKLQVFNQQLRVMARQYQVEYY